MNKPVGKPVIFLIFIVSRLVLATTEQPVSTLAEVNVHYALEAQRAASQGISFYRLHEKDRALDSPHSMLVERAVEYPPLAILWMKIPTWFMAPASASTQMPDAWVATAKSANRIALFFVDLCGFAMMVMLGATSIQLAVYTVGGQILFPLLYDRLDLLLGVLLLCALALLVRKWPYWAPLVVLAVAINYKITPLVMVPLFVLGTLPSDAFTSPVGLRLWVQIFKRLAIIGSASVAVFLPFFAKDGIATIGFLRYHTLRGLEFEAVWNTLPILMTAVFQTPATTALQFGAVEMKSPMSEALRRLASVSNAAVIPGLAFIFWKLVRKLPVPEQRGDITVAQAHPAFTVRCAVVGLLTAVVGAHVFSPQYMLWLVPLVALCEGRSQQTIWMVFLAICIFTTAAFPFMFSRSVVAMIAAQKLPLWSRLLFPAPLITRNLLLVGFTVWLWRETLREQV